MPNVTKDLRAKLYKQLMANSEINPETGCMVWTSYTLPNGYAQIWLPQVNKKRRKEYVHRVAWVTFTGQPIPEGHEIDHVADRGCISKACWNVTHLEPVPPVTNKERRDAGGVTNQHGTWEKKMTPEEMRARRRQLYAERKSA